MAKNFKTGVILTGDASGSIQAVELTSDALEKLNKSQARASAQAKTTSQGFTSMAAAAGAAAGVITALAGSAFVSKFKDIATETDRLRAALETVTGSATAAKMAFSQMEEFAAKTPFALEQSVNAFIKLKTLGLDPSERALMSFANTASANAKDLTMVIEAVADASTFQFERLRESFNITSTQLKDEVEFTFMGVTTTVEKNAAAIVEYLTKIGEVNFAGATGNQMNSLVGAFSNLGDAVDEVFRTIADLGASDMLRNVLKGAIESVNEFNDALPGIVENTGEFADVLVKLGEVAVVATIPAMARLSASLYATVTSFALSTAAATALTSATAALSSVVAFLGGPVGIAFLAGAAILAFADSSETAEDRTRRFREEAEKLNETLGALTVTQIREQLVELGSVLNEQERQLEEASQKASEISNRKEIGGFLGVSASTIQEFAKANERVTELGNEAELTRARIQALTDQLDTFGQTAEESATGLDDFSKSVVAAAADAAKALAKLQEEKEKLAKTFNESNDPEAKFLATMKAIKEAQATGLITQTALDNAIQDAVDTYAKAKGVGDDYNDMLEEGRRLTEESLTPLEKYNAAIERLQQLRSVDAIDDTTLTRQVAAAADELAEANITAAEQATNAWADFGKTLQESFRDSFIAAEGDLGNFLDRVETALKEAAYRWAFDSTIGALFSGVFGGGGFAGTTAASGGGGGGSSLTGMAGTAGRTYLTGSASLAGINSGISTGTTYLINGLNSAGYTGAAQYVGTAYANTTVLGNQAGNLVGYQGGGAALGGAITAGAGVVGGYLGNQFGEAAFGRTADPTVSTIGQAGGALAGAAIGAQYGSVGGPIGAAIGAAVGAIAAVALGDKKHRDYNLGALVGPEAPANAQVAASGLRIAAYDRRSDGDVAVQFTDTLMQIDAALTSIIESTGVDVNLAGRTLRGSGTNSDVATGNFFGAKGKTGKTAVQELGDAPTEFVRAWLAEVNSLLPMRVREIMEGVDGTAGALVDSLAAAIQIDRLLNLDVVKDTRDAIDVLLEPQKTLLELYDATTESVLDLSSKLDGSSDSLINLTDSLLSQKNAALELAMAYQGVQLETSALFGNAADQIRQALMTEEELYADRRAQIAALTAQLAETISPDEISRIQNEIVSLTGQAFQSLAPDQQQTVGQEFLSFLSDAQAIAEQQLQAGLDALASREDGIRATLDLELEVTQAQQRAVMDQQTAVDQFGTWVQQLTSGQAQITINIPGYGSTTVQLGDITSEITL